MSPGQVILYITGTLLFVATSQATSLDGLACSLGRGACVPGPMGFPHISVVACPSASVVGTERITPLGGFLLPLAHPLLTLCPHPDTQKTVVYLLLLWMGNDVPYPRRLVFLKA